MGGCWGRRNPHPHFPLARAEVEVQAALEALVDEAGVGRHCPQALVLLGHEVQLPLGRLLLLPGQLLQGGGDPGQQGWQDPWMVRCRCTNPGTSPTSPQAEQVPSLSWFLTSQHHAAPRDTALTPSAPALPVCLQLRPPQPARVLPPIFAPQPLG